MWNGFSPFPLYIGTLYLDWHHDKFSQFPSVNIFEVVTGFGVCYHMVHASLFLLTRERHID